MGTLEKRSRSTGNSGSKETALFPFELGLLEDLRLDGFFASLAGRGISGEVGSNRRLLRDVLLLELELPSSSTG